MKHVQARREGGGVGVIGVGEDNPESRQAGKDVDAVLARLIKGRGQAGGMGKVGALEGVES